MASAGRASTALRSWPRWLALLKISKVPFWFIWLTPFLFGYLGAARDLRADDLPALLFAVAGLCVLEAVNCLHNELVDQTEDRINQPRRHDLLLSVGEDLLRRIVWAGYAAVFAGILAFALLKDAGVGALMLVAAIAAPLYNWGPHLKRRPGLAEIAMGWASFAGFLAGWAWHADPLDPPIAAAIIALFITLTSAVKDLPDGAGDAAIGARGFVSVSHRSLRRAFLAAIYGLPHAAIVLGVLAGSLPPAALFVLAVASLGLAAMMLGERARDTNTFIIAYELGFLYAHLFMLALFVAIDPTATALAVAGVLLALRLASLALGLAPRFVEPDFTWRRGFAALLANR